MRIKLLWLVSVVLLLGCSGGSDSPVVQQPTPSEPASQVIDMNAVLDGFIANNTNVPSISMLAVKDGQVFYQHGAGFYDADKSKTANEDTLYITSSVGKLVISVAIMQQVEQNLLDLDEDISTYTGFEVRNPNFPDIVITARMLMKHEASLAHPASGEGDAALSEGYDPFVRLSLFPLIRDAITPGSSTFQDNIWLNVAPGSLNKNSNYGMTLLGYVVEQISGLHFSQYARLNIFEPIGMFASSYHYPDVDTDNLAGFFDSNNGLLPPFSIWFYPAIMLYTSTGDWAKLMMAMLNGGTHDGAQILQSQSVEALLAVTTPANNQLAYASNIGLVWREAAANQGWIGHTGAAPWVTHVTEINPVKNMGYVIFTNEGRIDSMIGPGGSLNTVVHQWLQEQ